MPNEYLIALHHEVAQAEENLCQAQQGLRHARQQVVNARAIVDRAKAALARWEGIHPDQAPRRGHLRRVVTIPILIGAGVAVAKALAKDGTAAKALATTPRKAMFIGGTTVAAGGALAIVITHLPPHVRPSPEAPRPPVAAPGHQQRPHIGPPVLRRGLRPPVADSAVVTSPPAKGAKDLITVRPVPHSRISVSAKPTRVVATTPVPRCTTKLNPVKLRVTCWRRPIAHARFPVRLPSLPVP